MAPTPHIAPHPEIPGVQVVTTAPVAGHPEQWSGPFAGIVGGLHGNEPCGFVAIEKLAAQAQAGELSLAKGTLFLIHGNEAAGTAGLRHTEDGIDINRLFDYHFIENLPESRWTSEHRRALELRPLLSSLDAALDLHSATAATAPFAIVTRVASSATLARQLGLPFITHGWEGPGLLGSCVLLEALSIRDKPSIAVECGQHDDPTAMDQAYETAAHFLAALGMLTAEQTPARRADPALELVIVDAVKKPSPGFKFIGPLVGLQHLASGTLVGADDNLEIRCKRDCFVIMPNASVDVGNDMLYLADPLP